MKSTKFHAWNLLNFMKSAGFHEIHWISWSTTKCCAVFFMRSNTDIHYMLNMQCIYKFLAWNPPDFMKSARFHGHEICQIPPWNLPNFMKSARFHGHEIHQISWNQWPWNLPNFMAMKSASFHEICQISQGPMVLFLIQMIHPIRWVCWLYMALQSLQVHHQV